MMGEIWKNCPSVDGLEVSSDGRVRVKPYVKEMPYGGLRTYGGHAWNGTIARDVSRPRYVIRFRGRTHKVHRLVCEAFHGPEPFPNADVIHRDGNTLHNQESNLRWATRSEIISQPRNGAVQDTERNNG